MKLDKEQIKHIADLARLELSDEEFEKFGSQLSDVLSYIDQLQEVDTTGVEETAQVTGLTNALREDVARSWDKEELDIAFKQAPDFEDGQIKVKRVL
jgi:aspartyl-tRNA(Asn)/glutamyl-tRNA(Gln) amidotransferase subunit C